MARSGVPGIDLEERPDPNKRVLECGCVERFCGPPVNWWVAFDRCAEHQAVDKTMPPCETVPDAPGLDETLDASLRERGVT